MICLPFFFFAALPQTQAIDNGIVRLQYTLGTASGVRLDSIGESAGGFPPFILQKTDLWSIDLRDQSGSVILTIEPSTASAPPPVVTSTSSSFVATWTGVPLPPPYGTIDVTVTATAHVNDFAVSFDTVVNAGNSAGTTDKPLSLLSVVSPRVQFEQRPDTTEDMFAYPKGSGQLFPDPMHNKKVKASYAAPPTHPGKMSMQFACYYNPAEDPIPNLFMGTRDGEQAGPYGYAKSLAFAQIASSGLGQPGQPVPLDALRFEAKHYPADNAYYPGVASPTTQYSVPYSTIVGVLRGDWYDAAVLYRKWAVERRWAKGESYRGPIRTSASYSTTIADADMFAINSIGTCCPDASCGPHQARWDVSTGIYWPAQVQEQKAFFGIDQMPTYTSWWDRMSYEDRWGQVWPPDPVFDAVAGSVAAAGTAIAPYINALELDVAAGTELHAPNVPPAYDYGSFPADPDNPGIATRYAKHDIAGQPAQNSYLSYSPNLECAVPLAQESYVRMTLDMASTFPGDAVIYWLDQLRNTTFADGMGGLVPGQPGGVYLDLFSQETTAPFYTDPYYMGGSSGPVPPHQTGGGSWLTQAKIQMAKRIKHYMRNTVAQPIPEFFLYSEQNSEMYVGLFEMTSSQAQFFALDAGTGPGFRPAPMFETVYHDYQRTVINREVNFKLDPANLPSASVFTEERRLYATELFCGYMPRAGQRLSDQTLADINDPGYPGYPLYSNYLGMIQKFVGVLTRDDVKEFTVLGTRLRDFFETSNVSRVRIPIPNTPDGAFGVVYDEWQPMVYVSLFGRPDLNAFCMVLLNWTDSSDSFDETMPPMATGGTQSVSLTLDTSRFGMLAGTYAGTVILGPTGGVPTTFDLSTPLSVSMNVAARSARVVLFQKI